MACSSGRGSRRCSRSPRTRTGAGRSCGSRPGRCRDGRRRTAGSRRRCAAARRAPSSGAAAGARSVVMARECSRRRSPGGRSDRSATIRPMSPTRPHPVMSGARLRVARARRGDRRARGGRARSPIAPDELASGRWRRAGARRRSPSGTWPGRSPPGSRRRSLSDAPAHLVADDDIDVVVELMGGDEPAHTLIAAALSMGKAVVTANKHVIAHHGPELEAIARRTGVSAPLRGARSAAASRSSGRWRRTWPPTASSASAASSTGRRTSS